ncbi:hypothetical protein CBR_g34822 [Chara braunii]|uniref:BED-type domain-containing protein n=1 Tax=Chara braunii TaxID=69332 RepID=A0A388LJN5_CHABU|nr:hypothetical protein CBR_g34822 [Chara braunii]|eukprot:GBG82445.1 hypothetical protein CBR_g34822 [Chara braunii]
MGRAPRRLHEPAPDHVQDTFRARSPVYRYLVVGQKVDNKGVMMLRCTFCNKVFQGTLFQATRHFTQTNYCKDVSDEALYEIARRTQQKFEADQTERVARYAVERGLDVPDTGGARGGEAGQRPVEGGVGGDGGHGAPDHPLGGGGGDTEEGVIHFNCEARGPGEEGVPKHEDGPEFYPRTGERMEDWRRRAGKGAATEGSSKRKEGGTDPVATPTGKRLRQQKFGAGAPELQRCALRVMHMWSCASPAERNWPVHEGIHVKKRNQLAFEKVVQLIEITANVRLTEYRWVGCGYVLPWQWDEGMLDCQAGLEVEPVRTGTSMGMTEEEIVRQVALITRDPIGASSPPSADVVFGRRACINHPYPREDDLDEESVPEAADDPALRIPREIDETHDDLDSEETRAYTARRASATATANTKELGSALPQRGLLYRGGAVRQLRLRSLSPRILQEEGALSAAAVEGGMAPAAVADATIAAAVDEIAAAAAAMLEEMAAALLEEAPAAGGGAAVEGQVAAAGGAAGGTAAVEVERAATVEEEEAPSAAAVEGGVAGPVEEEIAAQTEVQCGGDDERLMQQFLTEELDPVIAGMTPGVARGFGISDSEMGTHLDFDLSMGLPRSCGGATSTDRAPSRDEATGQTLTQTPRERTTTESPDAARDIMERERARLFALSNPRAQAFARALEEARLRETGGDCVQGRVVAVDEAVQAGQRRDEGAIDARCVVQETATGPVVPFSGLHLAQGRQSQAVHMAVHGVPPPVITDLGSDRWLCPHVFLAILLRRRTTAAREVPASGCEPQRGRSRGVSTESLEHALRAATRAVLEQTPRKRGVPPRPRPVPAEGGAALGESSRAEGLGMPRGSRREQTVAEARVRVVVLRKGGDPITIEEDDRDTDAVVREEDEDYEGEEEGEEESRSDSDGDDDNDYDEPPPPP